MNNILPQAIAARLKNVNGTIADYYDGASVLFADVVDFTPLSAKMTAVGKGKMDVWYVTGARKEQFVPNS